MMTKDEKNEDAIVVKGVSKRFVIPHDKSTTLKGAFINFFHRSGSEIFDALSDISFEVKKGEFFGIIGRNGSGKSTLLKILAGIYVPNKGSIKIKGRISPFLELGIGFNPELSGRDNIYLNGTVLGLTKKQIDEKFDSIVAFSELERFIDQKLKNYSSGMSVRLAFSVAVHANRDILLMDEVLAVGDMNFQSKCLKEFIKYKEQGKTVILVTHDIDTVQKYCDRVMLIRNGKIEKIGNPEEVGNEYIHQNMSDEEKRIFDEEKRKLKDKEKELEKLRGKEGQEEEKETQKEEQKIAEITEVKFLDENEKEKRVFKTGDFLKIVMFFKFNKASIKPLFGISIINGVGNIIYGTNNYKRKSEIELVKEGDRGSAEFVFQKIALLEGEYKVNVAIAENSGSLLLDQRVGDYFFKISKGLLDDYGIVELEPNVFVNVK